MVGYGCLVMLSYSATINSSKIITIFGKLAKQYLVDIKTLPNFAIVLCVFTFVLKIKERNNHLLIWPIFVFITLFIIVTIIEIPRKLYLEPIWQKNKYIVKINNKLDGLYQKFV